MGARSSVPEARDAHTSTRALEGVPVNVPPVIPSTGTDSVTQAEPPAGAPISAVVVPTMRPERTTSIVQEKLVAGL